MIICMLSPTQLKLKSCFGFICEKSIVSTGEKRKENPPVKHLITNFTVIINSFHGVAT